jgi:hypothetical protein
MSHPDGSTSVPPWGDGSTTSADGTPIPVDVSRDRRARVILALFVAGPIIWFLHFMVVYLAVEAGCTGDGPGLEVFDPPVPTIVTLAATVVAAVACLWCAGWGYRRWRASARQTEDGATDDLSADFEHGDRDGTLAFAGFLLSVLSFVAVLFVGLPALVLPAC